MNKLTDRAQSRLPDFDTLKVMAEQQPEALEALRVALTNEVLASAPAHRRRQLEGTCFRIDMTRRRAKTPLQCCINLSTMMWDSFYDLRAALNEAPAEPANTLPASASSPDSIGKADNVVSLFPRSDSGKGVAGD